LEELENFNREQSISANTQKPAAMYSTCGNYGGLVQLLSLDMHNWPYETAAVAIADLASHRMPDQLWGLSMDKC
jgi:hypothetical protein